MSQDSRPENLYTLIPRESRARRYSGYFVDDITVNLPVANHVASSEVVEYADIVTDPDLPTFG